MESILFFYIIQPSTLSNLLIYSANHNHGLLPDIDYIISSLNKIYNTSQHHKSPEINKSNINIIVEDSLNNKGIPGAHIYLYRIELLTESKTLV